MSTILTESPRTSLQKYLARCQEAGVENLERIEYIASGTIKYLRGNSAPGHQLRVTKRLESRWYKSVEKGTPDWSVYGDEAYLGDLWACWIIYSRKYLHSISKVNFGQIEKVVDLGCGIGYTSAALSEIFEGAKIMATNLPDIAQTRIAMGMGQDYGFSVVNTVDQVKEGPIDFVFASEYFEHFEEPISHLREILFALQSPRYILVANSFNARSIGHFDYYKVGKKKVNGHQVSKLFNSELKRYGYIQQKTGWWNNRPRCWKQSN